MEELDELIEHIQKIEAALVEYLAWIEERYGGGGAIYHQSKEQLRVIREIKQRVEAQKENGDLPKEEEGEDDV